MPHMLLIVEPLGQRAERDGEGLLTDGPFAETKELIAGYTLIQVRSIEEADFGPSGDMALPGTPA